ncbi:MAG: hypothetical protein LBQ66_15570 [Planctomycetaceae bacterium]|nr:hypothetical protein [Planctomycetaceae bacterium]
MFRPLCFRLAPLAENTTAQRSVAHLTLMPSGRLATLRSPNRFGVPFKLVRCYNTQRRAGRPRSSPSPLRGYCRLRRRNRPAVGCLPYDHRRINRHISSGTSPRR